MESIVARQMHRTLEPFHGMIYFVPERLDEYRRLELDDTGSYFVSRSAPMGAIPAEVVIATFYNFEPGLVRRSMESVWERVSPAAVVEARYRAADRGLRRVLGDEMSSTALGEAVALARRAAEGLDPAGRPLFAGHASVGWPDELHLQLWHAVTLLREFRGDGHIAVLLEAGVAPCEALVLHAGSGEVPAGGLRSTRAWADDAWDCAVDSLASRGLVASDGSLTDAGRTFRDDLETATDRLDLQQWDALGEAPCQTLRQTVRPWSKAIVAAGTFGFG